MSEQRKPEQESQFPELSSELDGMAAADQAMRHAAQAGEPWDSSIDDRNTARLKEIIDAIGWPSSSKVGKVASQSAWILAQHADDDVDFQAQCLNLMRTPPDGEVETSFIAYLEDRVRVNTGQPQIYGTQFYFDESGHYGPRPIEDIDEVEQRRQKMDLEPYADYFKKMMEA